ncbi:MAG: hypothetical protein ABSG21_01035 [Spirochaetia bacterium]
MTRTGRLGLFIFVLVLMGCPVSTPPGAGPDTGGTAGDLHKVDELFVQDAQSPTRRVFRTNDPAYQGPYGSTLWTLAGSAQEPFQRLEVKLIKVEGDDTAGYGVVFCSYDTGDPASGETMLVAMINTRKEFIVGEVAGAAFTEIIPWTGCESLRAGYSQSNVLRVTYAAGEYCLCLNGTEAARFRDDEEPRHDKGGRSGYIVVISPLDGFPSAHVHVIFEEQ